MRRYKNKILIFLLSMFFIILFFGGEKMKLLSVEDLDIYIGVGDGIDHISEGKVDYRVSAAANMYKEDGTIDNVLRIGRGYTIGQSREDRQTRTGRRFFLGLISIYLVDEEYARYGIRTFMDIVFKNPVINDNAYLVVCKGKNEDYFNYRAPGYDNPTEYMSDMIKNSVSYNFFKENYMVKNAILSMDAEGKNIVAPYLEIDSDGIKITGMGVFNKGKLAAILDIRDAKTMNMLRENKVKGIISLQKDAKHYVDFQAKVSRKIKCNKIGDKYSFTIDLKLQGEIIDNQLYKDLSKDTKVMDKFQKDMEKQVEETCNVFLDKMKNQYKVDMLQLGWVAAAKYGRGTGVDWNEIVSNSDIKVNVKVKVDQIGRGEFQ